MSIKIRLPLAPSANVYWRHTRQGRIYVSPEAMAFRAQVAAACTEAWQNEPLAGEVGVKITAWICDRRRDTDSVIKQTLDALQGYAFNDDNQVVYIEVNRFKAMTRKQAYMDVLITDL